MIRIKRPPDFTPAASIMNNSPGYRLHFYYYFIFFYFLIVRYHRAVLNGIPVHDKLLHTLFASVYVYFNVIGSIPVNTVDLKITKAGRNTGINGKPLQCGIDTKDVL